ncbi:hypothetical protein BCON_0276g00030 [Botryotinia convoluta]|uniref:Uncharacterized protein n=1 Tax=Botryotinia convoluta TaxID=54673 RepID=A0A4Z1HR86_9HELO|nr:hypothetical protein BCON_0276g00030 [Botryotinia convoluta]
MNGVLSLIGLGSITSGCILGSRFGTTCWCLEFGTTTVISCGAIHNAPLFIQRPSDCHLNWLRPWVQELQSDHESQIRPPVLPPQPEEQDHTPEPQLQAQGTNQEPSQPSQPQVVHEAQSLPLSIGLGEEINAVDPPSNLNDTPVVRCLICTRNHPTGDHAHGIGVGITIIVLVVHSKNYSGLVNQNELINPPSDGVPDEGRLSSTIKKLLREAHIVAI